jgi:adenylylsulfate kinase
LWFTGLSGAGKSTLANALAAALETERSIEILDGDAVRTHLSAGLTFSREDRDTNVHRIAFVARLLASHGVAVVTAAISPYRDTRAAVRTLADEAGVPFIEIFANASLDALVARDPKGLYKRALAGEIPHFTGVSDPYEAPLSADIEVFTDRESIDVSVATIIGALRSRGLIPATPHPHTSSSSPMGARS